MAIVLLRVRPVIFHSKCFNKKFHLDSVVRCLSATTLINNEARYSMEQMYTIVSQVEHYHEFVPWCKESLVSRGSSENSFDCRLTVGFPPLLERYNSRVTTIRPFEVKVEFQFKLSFHSQLTQLFFDEVIKKMVRAFFKRAETLYGPQSVKSERLKVVLHEES
ncbi:hypothetical protein HELRODRAFT_159791 [Helobdella robusta]|uniref:Coenzyme Q-binding protein COQ10 START domain-containing protein n=1 Tax=Helobdella robusta TaxID=6412 RepID=T1EPE8_HELRO|nr:hypothetical protein HELRODRAFT_159791 [Helobdella robusta]ESO13162.1 hypothetical protein HELRODRAFT_159791 [Helobdella robusta]